MLFDTELYAEGVKKMNVGRSVILKKITALFASVIAIGAVNSAVCDIADTPLIPVSTITAEAAETIAAPTVRSYYKTAERSVTINWNAVSKVDGYYIYRYSENCPRWIKVGEAKGNEKSFESINLLPGLKYNYKLKSYKIKDGKKVFSNYSQEIKAATIPAKSVIVSATKTSSKITLVWNKNSGSGYELFWLKNGAWSKAKTVTDKNIITYTISGLKPNTKYSFKIRTTGADENGKKLYGAYSDVRNVTTSAATAVTDNTPVGQHGQLSVSGANIVDKNGEKFKIKGMSTHGIMWEDFSDILTKDSLKVLRDDWKCNTVRIAMYTEEWGGYTTGSSYATQAKQKVYTGVKNATELGMYVIIDWHILSDGNPQTHQAEAVQFFTEMSKKYKDQNNVIYEICNEPNSNRGNVTWSANIKPYAIKIISTIRKYDSNALIICGTGTWSQDIHDVLNNKLSDKNTVYALHFYANTHTDWLRNRLRDCYNKGLPILVSEFGTCDASGNGGFNEYQSKEWFKLLDSLKIGYINWSACGKNETASAFKSGTNLKVIKSGESQLTQSGKLVRSWFRAH